MFLASHEQLHLQHKIQVRHATQRMHTFSITLHPQNTVVVLEGHLKERNIRDLETILFDSEEPDRLYSCNIMNCFYDWRSLFCINNASVSPPREGKKEMEHKKLTLQRQQKELLQKIEKYEVRNLEQIQKPKQSAWMAANWFFIWGQN